MKNKIKGYLAGSVGVEIAKNEPYAVFPNELAKAKEIANDMVEKFGMGKDSEDILDEVKAELNVILSSNYEEIGRLKDMMMKDEVIVF